MSMIIETERLFLRKMTAGDFDALYKVLADSDSMKYYPYSFGKKEVENWINKNLERYLVFGFGLWAVCLKSTHEVIGDCGLTMQLINGQIKPEIGYHISTYIAIDLKSFYASVECMDRNLNPMTTNLVVADESRSEKTIFCWHCSTER